MGGFYNIVCVFEVFVVDDEYWIYYIIVKDKYVVVKINDKVVVDYEELEGKEGDVKFLEGMIVF